MKNKKAFLVTIVSLIFVGSVNMAFAAGLTQSQINAIIGLLQSFGADSAVINNVQTSLTGGTPTVISGSGNNSNSSNQATLTCIRLSRNLYLGQSDKETDNEVSKLQKFLKDSGHFTYPTITGYYGPATELAVQKFQAAQSIVSAGSYETTGYGVVGPKTQEKIVSVSCGNVISPVVTSATIPAPTPVSAPTPTPTTETQTTNISPSATSNLALQISNINAIPTLNSVQIEWNTNKPANSKVFLTGGNLSSKVYSSESGLSTRHVVHISGLTSGTTYSYEIEAIANNQVVKSQGSFTTTPDEYSISAQPDKVSVAASGWNPVNIKVSTLKNGQIQANQSVSMTTPDSAQNRTQITNNISTTGANDWYTTFNYYPKTVGIHIPVFSWNGVNRSISIQAAEYIETAPIISELSKTPQVIEVNSISNVSLGYFKVSKADENISGEAYDVKYESDLSIRDFVKISKNGNIYSVSVTPKTNTYSLPVGQHTITIKEVKVVGISSGQYFYVSGLPIIFALEIKDIPQAEIIPIKNSYTYTTLTNGTVKNIGTIGSFKIKLNSNSGVYISSCNIRIENSSFFKGYIGKKDGEVGHECENSDLAKLTESSTNNEGVSDATYYLFVGWVGTHDWGKYLNLPESIVKFYIENLKIKDTRTGIIRTIQNPPVFEMNIVKP